MSDAVASRSAADRHALDAHTHGGLDDLHTELDKSAVHEAARENDLETLRAIVARDGDAAVRALDKYGLTALHWAAERGHADVATFLVGLSVDDVNIVEKRLFRRTPLHFAAVAPSLDVVRVLLAHGADADAREYRGWTALHYAAYAGAVDIMQVLLDYGCDARRQTTAGETAFHVAAGAGRVASVDFLLAHSADIAMELDTSGHTAREVALAAGHIDVAQLLPAERADEGLDSDTVAMGAKSTLSAPVSAASSPALRSDMTGSIPSDAVNAPAS